MASKTIEATEFTLVEKSRIVAAWWAFLALEHVERAVWRLTRERVDLFRTRGRTNRLWDFWIWLASYAYNIDDVRRSSSAG